MRIIFIIFLLVVLTKEKAQTQPAAYPQLKLSSSNKSLFLGTGCTPSLQFLKKDSAITNSSIQSRLPLDFYSQHLGTACKLELQLEKQTKLPIRIRLGSKEQVDYLEGKFSKNR